ncbi:hypothetical protein A9993_13220 [Rahnella victoriana]|nr:hypothetical protein A9993_13220 [Rahnella victoriana]
MVARIFIIVMMLMPAFSRASDNPEDLELNGSKFIVYVKALCPLNDEQCDEFEYHSINKKNNSELRLKGTGWYSPSGRYLGYIFKNKTYTYTLTQLPSDGDDINSKCGVPVRLEVFHNDKFLTEDKSVCDE